MNFVFGCLVGKRNHPHSNLGVWVVWVQSLCNFRPYGIFVTYLNPFPLAGHIFSCDFML